MRLIAVCSAFLICLSALDAKASARQTSDALASKSLESARESPGAVPSLAGSSVRARLLTALAVGAVGAGLGFFASQVLTSDWERNRDEGVDRRPWAAVGGSIGFAVGFSFPLTGRGSAPQSVRRVPDAWPRITADQLEGTGVATAYEAVELLRPEWLTVRGFNTIGEDLDPGERIVAYLDDVRLGGVDALKEVGAHDIRSIHFLDAAASTYRWGAGHTHGAILVLKEDGSSPKVRVEGDGSRE